MSSKGDPMNAWSIYDHIDEYRGKVALKERDHRAYYESSQFKKKQNDLTIRSLRDKNKEKRVSLAQKTLEGDERVIISALSDEKETQLALRRKTAETAVEELDQKSCELAKQLNLLRYEREQKEQKVKELDVCFNRMKDLADQSTEKHEKFDRQTQRVIENNLDKAKIKYETAKKIQKSYQAIVKCLEEERLTLPKKLRALERSLDEQRAELQELIEINKDAHIKRDTAKAEQTQLEQKMIEAKRFRDRHLTRMKKQAEKQKDLQEKIERRARATIQQDDPFQDGQQPSRMDEEEWIKVTTFDEALRRIKDATGVSSVEEIEVRFLNQDHTYDHLSLQKKTAEKTCKYLKDQKEQLQKQYEAMKYSGESRMSQGEQMLERMKDHFDKDKERLELNTASLDRSHRLLVSMKEGSNHLYETLKEIKLTLPLRNTAPSDDPVDVLNVCENKIVHLMNQANLKDAASVTDVKKCPEFREYMESHISADNLRVNLDQPDQYDSDGFGYDSQDNEEMMTNADIKKQGQQLMDFKRNKRRTKKRKS
ncbi:putative coiled-coil domain-containing protein [Apostichopus japonicus]|uniref:Putative coiled-coil domain-containing protein n=1 Tax=Stichopus japonicus TaxID=307972 RepID=A0A2G8JIP0_STIJA|nr:putative coiled-coil domain-containing protein [Apostichopus japonicus]